MPTNQDTNFGIEFIDPDEFIKFVQEGDFPEDDTDSMPEEPTSNEEETTEPDLVYTDKIAEEAQEYVVKRQEETRGRLAVLYTIFTFLIFFSGIVIAIIDGLARQVSIIDNLSKVLPLLSGIFLGILGFVIGYYFKKDE